MRIQGKFELAQKLQVSMNTFLEKISDKEVVIWPDLGNEDLAGDSEENNVRYGPNATTAEIISQQNSSNKEIGYRPSMKLLDTKLRYPPIWPTGIGFRSREDWKLQILL